MLHYIFDKGESINRWFAGEVRAAQYYSSEEAFEADLNEGAGFVDIIYPCRKQYLQEGKIERVVYSDSQRESYKLYFPFENKRVEFSGFYHIPHSLYFFSKNHICVKRDGDYRFTLGASGGLKIWVDGKLQAVHTPYVRNKMTYADITLNLKEGKNEITVFCNDLAERDINYFFEMITHEEVEVILDSRLDKGKIEGLEKVLSNVHMVKDSFRNEEIRVKLPIPFSEDVEIDIKAEYVDGLNRSRGINKKIPIRKKAEEALLFAPEEIGSGVYLLYISAFYEGEEIKKKLLFENYKSVQAEGKATLDERKKAALRHVISCGDDIMAKVLAIVSCEGYTLEAERIFEVEIKKIEGNYDCSDFSLLSLMALYKHFADKLPEVVKGRIKKALLNFRYWIDEKGNDSMWYFSENHAFCLHSAQSVAGELFMEEKFKSGRRGRDNFKIGKSRLLSWFDHFFEVGLGEWNSVTYIPIDLAGFLGLYLTVGDEELKKLAERAIDYIVEIMAKNHHGGFLSSSYGRVYEKELKGMLTNETTFMNWIFFGSGYLNGKSRSPVLLSLGSYKVKEEHMELLEKRGVTSYIQGAEGVKLYSFRDKMYSLSSVMDYRIEGRGHQESIMHLNILNFPECQMWVSHPGEEVPSGEGRPSFWAGNECLPKVFQEENQLFIDYRINDEARVDFTHLYCKYEEFDEVYQAGDNKLFLNKAGVNILVYSENKLHLIDEGPTSKSEIRSYGKENFWYVLMDDRMKFDDFVEKYRSGSIVRSSSEGVELRNLLKRKQTLKIERGVVELDHVDYLEKLWK